MPEHQGCGQDQEEGEQHRSLVTEDRRGQVAQGEGEVLVCGDRVVLRGWNGRRPACGDFNPLKQRRYRWFPHALSLARFNTIFELGRGAEEGWGFGGCGGGPIFGIIGRRFEVHLGRIVVVAEEQHCGAKARKSAGLALRALVDLIAKRKF
jgi:hypothetical protein